MSYFQIPGYLRQFSWCCAYRGSTKECISTAGESATPWKPLYKAWKKNKNKKKLGVQMQLVQHFRNAIPGFEFKLIATANSEKRVKGEEAAIL